MQKILNKTEDIAFGILTAWCFLPAIMSIYTVVLFFLNKLPTLEKLESEGLEIGNINYGISLKSYNVMFYAFGIITIIFVALVILLSFKQIFNKQNIKKKPWYYFLSLLFLWAIVCTLKSDDIYIAIVGNYYVCDNLCSYFVYASVFVCATLIKDNNKRIRLLKTFAYVILYIALIMIVQEWLRLDWLDYLFPSFKAVVFNQFNHLGYMLCMTLYCFLTLFLYEDKKIYLIPFTIIVYALIMNDTFGSYLASLVVLPIAYIIYMISNHKIDIIKLIPVFLFVGISLLSILNLLPNANTLGNNLGQFGNDLGKISTQAQDIGSVGTDRMQLWIDTIERIKERPLFGFGPNGFIGANSITNGDIPHNEYLQITAFLGIPGIILFLGSLITLCVNKLRKVKKLSLSVLCTGTVMIVYLASACFGNPIFNTYPYFWMFFGLTSDDVLLDLNNNEIFCEEKTRINLKKLLSSSLGIILSVLIVFFAVTTVLKYQTEKTCEKADIVSLIMSETMAKAYIESNNLEFEKEYYLNATSYELVTYKPKAYGLGTSTKGNTLQEYEDYELDYDESQDYTNKVIRVIAHNKDDIEVAWVE